MGHLNTPPLFVCPNQHVRTLTPPGCLDMPCLDPMNCYRTSGESILKANQLILEIRGYIPAILAHDHTPELAEFAAEVHAALDEARQFREHLITSRGPAVLFECYPEDGAVLCRRVDPKSVGRNID